MRWLGRLSFQTKITLITLIMIVLIVVVAWGGIHFSILPAMERKVQDDAWHIAGGLVNALRSISETDRRTPSELHLDLFWRLMPNLAFVEIVDANGEPVSWFGDQRYRSRQRVEVLADKGDGVLSLNRIAGGTVYEVNLPFQSAVDHRSGQLHVGVSTDYIRHLRWQLFYVLSVVTVVVPLLGFVCIRWFSAMITRPVNRLLHMTHLLSQGKLEEVLDEYSVCYPCCREQVGPATAADQGRTCTCPLFHHNLGPDAAPEGSFRPDECRSCEIYQSAGEDELMRLLLAFRFMAVEILRYRDQVRQRYEFEERLLEACPDGIIANDRQGNIILFNTGAEQLLGYSRAEALEHLPVQRLYPKDEAREIKRALLSDEFGGPGILVDYNTRSMRKDGTVIPIRLSANILYEERDEFAVVGYFHDLTELQEHMSALFEANEQLNKANRELGRMNRYYLDMLSFVTHELKSPIANGYMSANALRQEIFGSLAPEQAIMVEATCRNLDQCMEMIRHYLDLSRIEKDELPVKPQSILLLSDVIDPVVTALAPGIAERGVQVELDVPADLSWFLDPELFRGVFTNLLSNALKYGEQGGTIRVSARPAQDHCQLEVWNTGPGIPAPGIDKLFKKFERLPESRKSSMRGTGLGLFITKTVVERHGGRIWVASEEGAWASFIMELPKDGVNGFTGADQGRDGA